MKNLRILSFAVLLVAFLLVPGTALDVPPQNASNTSSAQRPLVLTGTVSQKGPLLTSADQRLYRILNSETLKHLEGQLVTLKARVLPEKDQLYVEAVRAQSPAPNETFHLSDAAFRR